MREAITALSNIKRMQFVASIITMNLQLFADETNVTTDTGMTAEMKTFYNQTLVDSAQPNLVHDQFADKKPIPANKGKSIEFRKYDSLGKSLTPLVEGVTPKGHKLNVSTITATVDQYGDWVPLSDMVEMTTIDNNVVEATKLLGNQAGLTLDSVTRDVMAGGTNVIYAPTVANVAVTSRANLTVADKCFLTQDLILRAVAQLEAMNAPKIDGSYVGIVHPFAKYTLMKDEAFVECHKYAAPEAIFKNEIGMLGNVRFVQSSESKIWKDAGSGTAAGVAVFGTLIIGGHAYATTEIEGGGLQTIIKQLGYGDDPLNQRASCGWKATKVAERLSEQFMVRIEHCSDYGGTINAN